MKLFQKKFWTPRVLFIVTIIFIVLLVGSLLLKFVAVPAIVNSLIDKNVKLENGSEQFERFTHIPIVIDLKLYFFKITNPDEVVNNKTMPNLVEKGPYVYEQHRNRTIDSVDEDKDTVSFENVLNLKFSQEKSGNNSEEDKLNFINPIHIVITQVTLGFERLFAYGCLPKFLEPRFQGLIIKDVSLKEMVLEGILFAKDTDDIGASCRVVRKFIILKTETMRNIKQILNPDGTVRALRFSYLGYKLDQSDGIFEISRGIKDVSTLGQIRTWNRQTSIGKWGNPKSTDNDRCNRVRGTDATIYPPRVQKDTIFEIFATDICRTVPITFDREDTFMGIPGYRFIAGPRTFWSDDPETDCYCTKEVPDAQGKPSCYLDGVIEISKCFGEPVLLTFPHFLYAHPKYQQLFDELHPDPEKHQIFVIIEPNTGLPLIGLERVQLNLVLRPVSNYKIIENVPATILPVVWLEMSAMLTQDLADEMNSKFFSNLKIADILTYILIGFTAAGLLVSLIFLTKVTFFKVV